ncbi:MAG: phage tail tape measure protein [Oscillospiraceae bacterium]|nr:phage tail tape measure protein [Oscillospiraceae bacterium]
MNVFDLFATIGLKDDGFSSGLDKAKGALGTINDTANKVVGTIVEFGAKAGAALYALGAAGVAVGASFEKEMSNLQAITGMTSDEMKQMESGVREIAVTTGTNLKDLASNAKMLAEAGGDITLMMEQFTHGTNLANATQTDMATTLDFLGSTMKTFGIEAEDTQSAVDTMALTTTKANLSLGQIGESFANVGGAAANAGMDLNDVNAFLIAFSEANVKGGKAGTYLNGVISDLSTPTKAAKEELDKLGIALYDSEGASRDMFDIMYDLQLVLGDMTDEQRNNTEAVIFSDVALKGWNIVTANGVETLAELSAELSGSSESFSGMGQAAGMAAVQQDNLLGLFDKLKASVTDLGVEFYQNVDNPLKDVTATALGMVQQLNEALKDGGLEGLVSKIGDVLAQAVQFIVDQAPKFVESAKNLLMSLIQGLTENKDALITGAKDTFNLIIEALKEIIPALVPLAIDIITELASGFITYMEMIYTTGVEIVTQLLLGLVDKMPELITQAKDAIFNIVQGLGENLPLILQAGIDIIIELARGIADMLPTLIPMAVDIILTLVDTLIENLDEIIIVALEIILALVEGIVEALPTLIRAIPRIVIAIVDTIMGNLDKIISVALDIILVLVDSILDNLPELIIAAIEVIIALTQGIIDNLDKIIIAAVDIILALIQGLISGIPKLIMMIPKIVMAIIDTLMETDWMEVGINILKGIAEGILNFVTGIVNVVKDVCGKIWDAFTGFFGIKNDKSDKARDKIGKPVVEGIADGINDNKGKATKAAQSAADDIYNASTSRLGDYENRLSATADYEKQVWSGRSGKYGESVEEMKRVDAAYTDSSIDQMQQLQMMQQTMFNLGLEDKRVAADEEKSILAELGQSHRVYNDEKREMALADINARQQFYQEDEKNQKTSLDKQKDQQKSFWDDAKLMIDDYRNASNYNIEEEIRMWENLKENYQEISKEKVEIDKTINKLREDLRKQEEEEIKKHNEETFNIHKTWIEARKNLNLMTIEDEIQAWEDVASKYEEGTKQREEADKNLSKARMDLRETERKALDEMEKLEQAYTDAVEKRAQAIFNTFSLFAEVNLQETNVDKNTKKVEESKAAYDKVQASLEQLDSDAQKAYGNLTKSLGDVSNEMQKAGLTQQEYDKLQAKAQDAQTKYADEMDKIQQKRMETIDKLNKAQDDLTRATDEAAKSQAKVMAENLEKQIAEMEKWEKNMKDLSKKGLDEGLLEELRKMGPTANRYLEQLINSSDEELKKLSDLYQQKHALARELAVQELEKLRNETDQQISQILNDLAKQMNSQAPSVGQNLINGILNGVNQMSGQLYATMNRIMQDMINMANQINQIRSPSKVWEHIATMNMEGMIVGYEKNEDELIGTVADLMEAVIDVAEEDLKPDEASSLIKRFGEGFIKGAKAIAGKVGDAFANVFSPDELDSQFNVRVPAFAGVTAGGGKAGNRPQASFTFNQTIVVGENTSRADARKIGKQLYQDAKEAARSKGVEVL